jgi:hypothetical protein
VSFESPDASSALGDGAGVPASGGNKLPHLDRPIQTTRHEVSAVGRECNRVDRVLVAIWALEPLHEVAIGGIPNSDALVKRPSSNILGVGRYSNGGDAIFNAESQDVLAGFDVPQADGTVAAAGCDGASITSKVKGVDILLVASEGVPDGPVGNIPNLLAISRYHKGMRENLLGSTYLPRPLPGIARLG